MKKLREKIATLFAARGMFRMFCFIRGRHLALEKTGRCLACGRVNGNQPRPRIAPIINRPLKLVANDDITKRRAFIRNSQIREESRRYGY